MTRRKYSHPRSKVRGRPDGATLSASIPKEIAYAMRLQPGDSIEWLWVTEGTRSFCRVRKVAID